MAAQQQPKKTLKAFLVFRAHDSNLRVTKTRPRLDWDEVAFEISVTVPQPWGRLAGAIVIELPDTGPAVVEVKQDAARP